MAPESLAQLQTEDSELSGASYPEQLDAPFFGYCRSFKERLTPVKLPTCAPLSPSIIRLTKSNQEPSVSEVNTIANAISERISLLKALDAEIAELSTTLSTLKTARKVTADELQLTPTQSGQFSNPCSPCRNSSQNFRRMCRRDAGRHDRDSH